MDLDRAKEIIQALADGVDPYTGETFPADGPYQRADTVRALFMALESLSAASAPLREKSSRTPRPVDPAKPRAGGKWTEGEDETLRNAFNAGTPISKMATDHGRTPGAITSRLVKLGLLEDSPGNRAGQGNRPPAADTPAPKPAALPSSPIIDPNDDKIPF